jgi:hypothetical protein
LDWVDLDRIYSDKDSQPNAAKVSVDCIRHLYPHLLRRSATHEFVQQSLMKRHKAGGITACDAARAMR